MVVFDYGRTQQPLNKVSEPHKTIPPTKPNRILATPLLLTHLPIHLGIQIPTFKPRIPMSISATSSSSSLTPLHTPPPNSPVIMSEVQPDAIQEGASDPHAPTGTADDRKAAAALSSLDAQDDDVSGKKGTDSKALGEAMKNLNVDGEKSKEEKKKIVKVDAQDVTLLVTELELSKPKATELLRAHDGNAVKAMGAFVSSSP
ncbi:hypothetical protein K504DRAFT_462951 [Pleomassaria siparia CBS 279.74]|uniref:Nascent polypeptide-associated complex subunit alpha-like UBA domain-containing protein n=1 Tax=Pleomassaria siparia CBS 279.74 TaxID=1314801 RepID=A0A6G1JUC3_9PLEO|nr:hypothetical protein K504DRAFT_462951 [Pleomassaria siparia CBS 279.74]